MRTGKPAGVPGPLQYRRGWRGEFRGNLGGLELAEYPRLSRSSTQGFADQQITENRLEDSDGHQDPLSRPAVASGAR